MKDKAKGRIRFLTEKQVINKLRENNLYEKYVQMRNMGKELFMNFCTGKSMKALTYDAIFKKIFNYEEYPDRLESFLTAILGFKVDILNILPVESNKMIEAGSVLIMDMVVKTSDGSIINVEMQKRPYEFTGQRDSCYISDMIMRQYNELKGRARQEDKAFNYKEMKPVYTIIFIEKAYYDMLNYPDKWEHNGKICFDSGLSIDFLENIKYIILDNFYKTTQNINTEKEQWVYLLGADTSEKVLKAAAFSEDFFQIVNDVAMFTMDVERVMDMFSDALYMLDRNTEKLMYDEAMEELERLREDRKEAEKKLEIMREENRKIEAYKQQVEIDYKKAETEKQQAEANYKKAETEKRQAEANCKKAETEKQQAEANYKKAETEKRLAQTDKEIYRLLFLGKTNAEIAEKLNISIEYINELLNA